jgi:NAD(P)-dependent dehydrogenase (short-subunit alcohol dehydrogenase family)
MADKPLLGKVALVTGSGRGMGREIALRLARDGASLIVHFSASEAGARDTVTSIQAAGGEAVAYRANIANRVEVQTMFCEIDQSPGRIDIVVNSAGVSAGGALAESWAKELGRKGVTVNTLIPGATSPGMMDTAPEGFLSFFEKASPFGRIGRATEIAAVVAFLASPQASWVSGAHILVNGAANA